MEDRCLLSAALPNGTTNAMVYDAAGKLWVAYYDAAAQNLKYAVRNADGSWAQLADNVIDSGTAPAGATPNVGQESISMVIERGGFPGVAYYDATNADLKYAHYNGASWDKVIVESVNTTGLYPSISFNTATNRPAISYYYKTGGDLRLRQFNGSNWGGPTDYQLIAGAGTDDVGRYSILRYDPLGRWAVVYDDTTNGAAKYSYQLSGGVWSTPKEIANTPADVAFTDMTFDSAKRPAVSYYVTGDANLQFSRANDTNGANAWSTVMLAGNTNSAGKYTNLLYDTGTDKFTVYYSQESGSNPLKINYRTGNIGASWTESTLYVGGSSELRVVKHPTTNVLTYSWSAFDGNAGQQILYVNDTTTGTTWRQDTTDAGMLGRVKYAGYGVHSVNGVSKMFAIAGDVDDGGLGATGILSLSNLVRASTDGGVTWSTWTPQGVGGTAPFAARTDAVTVSFQGKLWVIGGSTSGGYQSDVWSSPDGVTWTRGNDLPAGFGNRADAAATVSPDGSTMYLIGGTRADGTVPADVWATTDGQTWTRQTAAAPFGGRYKAAALAFNNRIWVLGGTQNDNGLTTNRDDAWWSADGGVTWTEATAPTGATRYTARAGHTAAVYDNRMWVLGGQYSGQGTVYDLNDAWYSFDGVNWTPAATGEAFTRNGAGTVVFGGRLVTMFGENMSMKNDVWSTT